MKRHKERENKTKDPSKRVSCLIINTGTNSCCNKTYTDNDGLRRHLCGRDGVSTSRAHSLSDIKKAYPKMHNLVTRIADRHRTTGLIRRSFTIAQKYRNVRRSHDIVELGRNMKTQVPNRRRNVERKKKQELISRQNRFMKLRRLPMKGPGDQIAVNIVETAIVLKALEKSSQNLF